MLVRDAWRLAVGTLTAMPVPPPERVDRRRAAVAMTLAPLAALPLALAAGAIALLGQLAELPHLVTALLAIGAVVVGNRALHLDGLADTVDGMAASYDRARSLEVMKTGTSGPAGVTAIVLVLGLQVAGLASLLHGEAVRSAVLVAVAVCSSRAALALCCARGIRPAREDGLGRTFTQTLPPLLTVLVWIVVAAALAGAGAWAGLPWWRGALAASVAAAVVGAIALRAIKRFGGVTGDVFGAAVEAALATVLVTLSAG